MQSSVTPGQALSLAYQIRAAALAQRGQSAAPADVSQAMAACHAAQRSAGTARQRARRKAVLKALADGRPRSIEETRLACGVASKGRFHALIGAMILAGELRDGHPPGCTRRRNIWIAGGAR